MENNENIEKWSSQITRKIRNLTKFPIYIFIIDYIHNIIDRLEYKKRGKVNINVQYDNDETVEKLYFSDNIMPWTIEYLQLALLNRNLDRKPISQFIKPIRAGLYKEAFVDLIIKFSKTWTFIFYDFKEKKLIKVNLNWDESDNIIYSKDGFNVFQELKEYDMEIWNEFKCDESNNGILFWTESLRNDKIIDLEDFRNVGLVLTEGEKGITNLDINIITNNPSIKNKKKWALKYYDPFFRANNSAYHFYDKYKILLFEDNKNNKINYYLDILHINSPFILKKEGLNDVNLILNKLNYLKNLFIRFDKSNSSTIGEIIINGTLQNDHVKILKSLKIPIIQLEEFNKSYTNIHGKYKLEIVKLNEYTNKLSTIRPSRNILKNDKMSKITNKFVYNSGLYDYRNGSWVGETNYLEKNNITHNKIKNINHYRIGFTNIIKTPTINNKCNNKFDFNLTKINLRSKIDNLLGYGSVKADAPDSDSRKELNNLISGIIKYSVSHKDTIKDINKKIIKKPSENDITKFTKNFYNKLKILEEKIEALTKLEDIEKYNNCISNYFNTGGVISEQYEEMKTNLKNLKDKLIKIDKTNVNYKFILCGLSNTAMINNDKLTKKYDLLNSKLSEINLEDIESNLKDILIYKLDDYYIKEMENIEKNINNSRLIEINSEINTNERENIEIRTIINKEETSFNNNENKIMDEYKKLVYDKHQEWLRLGREERGLERDQIYKIKTLKYNYKKQKEKLNQKICELKNLDHTLINNKKSYLSSIDKDYKTLLEKQYNLFN